MKISEIKAIKAVPFFEAAAEYVAAMPDDEVLTIYELSEKLGRQVPNGLTRNKIDSLGCKVMLGRVTFIYGNPKAIRALKKKLNSL